MDKIPSHVKALSKIKDKFGNQVLEGKKYVVLAYDEESPENIVIEAEKDKEMDVNVNDPDLLMIYDEIVEGEEEDSLDLELDEDEEFPLPKLFDMIYLDVTYKFRKINIDVSESNGKPKGTVFIDYVIEGFKGFETDTLYMMVDFGDSTFSFAKNIPDTNMFMSIESDELFDLANTLVLSAQDYMNRDLGDQ